MTDVSSILGALFGGGSNSTGKILATLARDSRRSTTSIAHLAREARLSETKTLREVNRLIELGLVVTELRGRYRHVDLNTASPVYAPLLDLLYLTYGVRPRTDSEFLEHVTIRNDLQIPFELVRLIPDELHPSTSTAYDEHPFADDHFDGPSSAHARQWERTLSSLAAAAGQAEGLLQDAYRTWRDERDRDLIHQVLHLGTGAAFAARVLARAADNSSYRTQNPHRVGRNEWRLATAAARAEAELCRATIADLERAVDLARKRTRELVLIGELEHHLADDRAAPHRDAGEHELADAADRIAEQRRHELTERRATLDSLHEEMRDTYRTGGLGVRVDEVNTAGERLIIARLRTVADTATAHAEAMEHVLATTLAATSPTHLASTDTPA